MENYIVSARKYRPETFDTVVGQSAITTTLKNAIKSGQLAQAFLFCGPRGVGKTTCARIFARTINCMNPSTDMEACGECESCVSFRNNASFNIHELDAASNNSVENIRSLIEQVRIPPQVGKFKIYIIDEVHMLSTQAFNAFLKTLEEPPSYAKFILATTEKHKIIPTILSRCQIFDFKRIKNEDMVKHLTQIAQKENVQVEKEALIVLAQKADGGLRDALSMFDQQVSFTGGKLTYEAVIANLNILDYEYYFKTVDAFLNADIPAVLRLFNDVLDRGFDGQDFLVGLGRHLRDLLVAKDPQTVALLEVGENMGERYVQQAQVCPLEFLIKGLEIVNQCDLAYRNTNNKRLSVELGLMQMASFFLPSRVDKVEDAPFIAPCRPASATQELATDSGVPTSSAPTMTAPSDIPKPLTQDGPAPSVAEKSTKTETPRPHSAVKPRVSIREVMGAEAQKTAIAAEEILGEDPFSSETFFALWEEWLQNTTDPALKQCMTVAQLSPAGEQAFQVTVVSQVQCNLIQEVKQELLQFLREKVNNKHLQFQIIVSENMQTEMQPYTPLEKFQKMCELNPQLSSLRQRLDLDVPY